nr:DNA repair and recombination protein [Pseudozyma thailandica]
MNSAAVHSSKLIAEFEKQQQQDNEPVLEYPSKHPFGATEPGPFGGASASTGHRDNSAPSSAKPHQRLEAKQDAFTADNEMSNFADWDASYPAAPADAEGAALSTDMTAYTAAAGPSRTYQPRALTQYDYPGGWGAQTFAGAGGLTQDSASRIATLQAKLNQRLGPEYLSQRPGPGGGKKLTYIEGWKLVDLANEVFGFNGWSTTIVRLDVDFLDCSPDGTRFNAGVSCVVRVTLRDGAFHEDIGYGSAENARQKHAALEKGKKEAVTDATKRALKNFGKLLGNCTYDHQYSQNALKVSNPAPKFDASELHRRPELRPPQPAAPQAPPAPQAAPAAPAAQIQPQNAARPTVPPSAPRAAPTAEGPAHPVNGTAAASNAPARSIASMAPPQPPAAALSAGPPQANTNRAVSGNEQPRSSSAEKADESISERQQRSLLARQAYLERQQQSEPRKVAELAAPPHQILTSAASANHPRPVAEVEFGSDSFDDGLNDVLATYDETDLGDAEAASHALEMEIEQQHGDESILHPNHNAADDSGVAFNTSIEGEAIRVKQEKAMELRRSTSPVKQVKMEAVKPRRAGSVGRFVSPPPSGPTSRAPSALRKGAATLASGTGMMTGAGAMRNGATSLSSASGARAPLTRRTTLLAGMGGVESALNKETLGRAEGVGTNHAYLANSDAGPPRGIKRASEAELARP